MRLPVDAALLLADEPPAADPMAALLEAWREEALAIFPISGADDAFANTDLEARLDAIGATTLVFAGASLEATALAAAERGYRVFVVSGEPETSDFGADVRLVSADTAVQAARRARFRQRWAARRERRAT